MTADQGKQQQKERKYGIKHPFVYGFSIFILIVIVVTFIGAPAVSNVAGSNRFVFGSYDGSDIEYLPDNYMSRQKDALADQVASQGGDANMEWMAYQIWHTAFQRAAIHLAVLKDAKKSGLDVSSGKIDEAIVEYGPFRRDGVFSADLYRQASSREIMDYRRTFREELIQNTYLYDLVYGVRTPQAEKDFMTAMGSKVRSFRLVEFTLDAYPGSEVVKFGASHTDLFRKINVSRITVKSSEAAAKGVLDQISADPSTFSEIAKSQSKDSYAEEGGLIGWQYYYAFKNDFDTEDDAKAVFALAKGEISEVIKTSFGWVIYKANESATDANLSLDSDTETVRTYMERYERGMIQDFLTARASEFKLTSEQKGFENASRQFALDYVDTVEFPVNYGNHDLFTKVNTEPASSKLDAAGYSESFFSTLFSLKTGETSGPVLVGDSIFVGKVLTEATLSEDKTSYIDFSLPYMAQQEAEEQFNNGILESELFKDNFDATFGRLYQN